jgi:hypothetical protein
MVSTEEADDGPPVARLRAAAELTPEAVAAIMDTDYRDSLLIPLCNAAAIWTPDTMFHCASVPPDNDRAMARAAADARNPDRVIRWPLA